MRTRSLLVALAVISALGLLLFLGWRTLVPRPEEPAGASSASRLTNSSFGFDSRGRVHLLAGRLDAVHRDRGIVEKGMEQADGVRAAADAGHQRIGQPAETGEHLFARLAADDALEVAHHHRIRVRTGDGADHVEGVIDVGDPVTQRLVQRVLQRLRAGLHRHDARTEQLHAIDVRRLALHVLGAHVDHAFEPESRGDGRGRDAVLAGAGLGDDARLAKALREQGLADGVVDLVRAGVVEVLALEVDLRAADLAAQAGRMVDGAGPPHEVRQFVLELGHERGIFAVLRVVGLQVVERVDEGLSNKGAAIGAEVPAGIGLVVIQHG